MLDACLTARLLAVSEPFVEPAPTAAIGTLRLVAEHSPSNQGILVVGLAKPLQSTASCSAEESLPA